MPMKLYMTPGSCSTGIHILLEELDLPEHCRAHYQRMLARTGGAARAAGRRVPPMRGWMRKGRPIKAGPS